MKNVNLAFNQNISAQYKGAAGHSYQESRHKLPDGTYSWVARRRAQKFMPYIQSTDIVIEYGVGHGWNMAQLNCHKRIGYDISDSVADIVRAQGIDFVSDLQTLRKTRADLVICHHVLEHVSNPTETLAEIRQLLMPNGKLFLVVPYEYENRFKRYNPNDPDHHLYGWSVQSLGNLLVNCGFSLHSAKVAKYGYERVAAVVAYRLRIGEWGYRTILFFAHLLRPRREIRILATAA